MDLVGVVKIRQSKNGKSKTHAHIPFLHGRMAEIHIYYSHPTTKTKLSDVVGTVVKITKDKTGKSKTHTHIPFLCGRINADIYICRRRPTTTKHSMDDVFGVVIFKNGLSKTNTHTTPFLLVQMAKIRIRILRLRRLSNKKVKVQLSITRTRCKGAALLKNFNESKVDVILRQPTIDVEARKSLVNCIFNLELTYHLDDITGFTAVEIFDRFLSAQVVSGKEAWYASVVAMHISSKYHETGLFRRPLLKELLECTFTGGSPDLNGSHCRLGMAMEDRILNALDMEIDVPTVHTFLIRFYKAAKIWPDTKTRLMASFYAKLGIWDYHLKMTFPTEKLAAAALYAACVFTHNISMWRRTYRSHTVFKDTQLWKCTNRMMELHLVGLGGRESCSWIIKNMILISQLPKKLDQGSRYGVLSNVIKTSR